MSVRPSVPSNFRRWKVRVIGASCAVYPALIFVKKRTMNITTGGNGKWKRLIYGGLFSSPSLTMIPWVSDSLGFEVVAFHADFGVEFEVSLRPPPPLIPPLPPTPPPLWLPTPYPLQLFFVTVVFVVVVVFVFLSSFECLVIMSSLREVCVFETVTLVLSMSGGLMPLPPEGDPTSRLGRPPAWT